MDNTPMLTAMQTAKILGISTASVRNWERHGYLINSDGKFPKEDVLNLLQKIKNGEISRLNGRANKKQAAGTIGPSGEYRLLCDKILNIEQDSSALIFMVSLKQFILKGLVKDAPPAVLLDFNPKDFASKAVFYHLQNRIPKIIGKESPSFLDAAVEILKMDIPDVEPSKTDIAGIIYQAIKKRGDRSVSGSFYTPVNISGQMITSALERTKADTPLFIDPCCGTGQFLLSFIASGGKPENSYGIDSDPAAAFTAASNILLECPEMDFQPKIYTCDSLLFTPEKLPEYFDLAVTNPPWGACSAGRRSELERRFPEIRSGESFSYFINRTFELTRPGGIISVVLPESITNVKRHEDIRNYILNNSRLTKTAKYGRIFKGVYSPAISLEMLKEVQPAPLSSKFAFNINLTGRDSKIIDKIYSAVHTTLEGKADWALGIVTGDNKKYVSPSPEPGFEPIIRGKDIGPGLIRPASNFISFDPDRFQQTAPEWKYRAEEKLVYRFISKKLVFAVEKTGMLTLNSANIIIPRVPGYSAEHLMELLNSDVYNFIHQKMFNSVKVLRSHLEKLPLPERMPVSGWSNPEELFNLTEAEISHIKNQFL